MNHEGLAVRPVYDMREFVNICEVTQVIRIMDVIPLIHKDALIFGLTTLKQDIIGGLSFELALGRFKILEKYEPKK